MINHKEIDSLSSHNKEDLLSSEKCGCYYCLAKFSPEEIIEWIDYDQTAICPKCKVDAIVSLNEIENENKYLNELNAKYFSYEEDDD